MRKTCSRRIFSAPTLVGLVALTATTTTTHAWSQGKSSFTGVSFSQVGHQKSRRASPSSLVMYDNTHDPPNNDAASPNAWTVLSKTEEWISSTLQSTNNAASAMGAGSANPYSRKEVSYVCEASSDQAMIVANLFRRLKEARELGESHGRQEVGRAQQVGPSYRPNTLRQTQVVVIPANDEFQNNFVAFNAVLEAVNKARRQARDLVTEAHWDRLDAAEDEDEEEWSVAVNCAHLHPQFGQKSPQEQMAEMQKEEEEGEVDVHYQEYQKRRLLARQSPYPTVVIEVRATPPPDFGASAAPPPPTAAASSSEGDAVTAADIMKLEQLFGKSAHMSHPTAHTTPKQEEEAFYSSIGGSLPELSAVTPLNMAQAFMTRVDPTIPADTTAFTESKTTMPDEAYEFVFTNLAMMAETVAQKQTKSDGSGGEPLDVRHYIVLPHFVTSAATSLEKFATQCTNMMETLPGLNHGKNISIQTYHPEHVHEAKRSPMPVLLLQWKATS